MSRPWDVYAHSANRRASVPHCGIPSGKSRFWPSLAFEISLSSRFPDSSRFWSASRVMPSMTSRGSMTFPRDLDILRPWASRTMACRNTCENGTSPHSSMPIMTIRATQKKRMSEPVSRSVLGKNALKSAWLLSGHPTVENGNSPEENHVSSTSSSWMMRRVAACSGNFSLAMAIASSMVFATIQRSNVSLLGMRVSSPSKRQ
mmetsp:Transcript_6419/g.15541  ORF Transcript_6419/g.15541 Transcript_6419/m.15541 type:complete len:203 (+) Transcript_6419:749-1357(+)